MVLNEQREIETIGAIVRKPEFIILTVIMCFSVCKLSIFLWGNYWFIFCSIQNAAFYGILGVMFTLAITSFSLFVSWIFVDDSSWFIKAAVLFTSSIIYIICGTYYFYNYFNSNQCDYKFGVNNSGGRKLILSAAEEQIRFISEHTFWTPLIVILILAQGVIYLLFSIYLFINLDD